MTAFLARVAPVQVNYLGYHASTGIPNMDYWLGDSSLFPPTLMSGVLKLVYLDLLLHGILLITLSSHLLMLAHLQKLGIRFGCFNHSEKYPMAAFDLVKNIGCSSDSRLVLKGTTNFDSEVPSLLDAVLCDSVILQ